MQVAEEINAAAVRWIVRADSHALSQEEQRELDSWLSADPRHRGAYVRARAQWLDLDRLAALRGPVQSFAHGSRQTQTETETEALVSRRKVLAVGIAATTLIGSGLSWMLMTTGRERYTSEIGEVRRLPLSDGTTVVLNTNTEVVVHLTKHRRDIQMIRGEALFEVAHDEARPFIVMAHRTAVRAVGTSFAVRVDSARVDVTVTEGVVEVSEPTMKSIVTGPYSDEESIGRRRVVANERAVVTHSSIPEIEPIAVAQANRQLAWLEGMVSFDGDSLQAAVNEINRHNRRQIVISDPVLASRPVVGVFRANDLEGFSAAAAAALNVRAVADGNFIRLE